MVVVIVPINFGYVCVMTTYYMFEYNTIDMTIINEHLSDKLSDIKKQGGDN